MCCVGVLIYHIMDDVLWCGKVAKIIYFMASFCIPEFFLLSGYLLGIKNELQIEYIEKKVVEILEKLVGLVIFWCTVHYIRTTEIYDILDNIVFGISDRGILPVSWFLFSYCFVMIIEYPLWFLKHKQGVLLPQFG